MVFSSFPKAQTASFVVRTSSQLTQRLYRRYPLLSEPGVQFNKNAKVQKRGKINLIGRLQLTTERMREEENEGIVQLRILRTQEAIIQIMKMRKKISNAQLQTELVEILKNMFLPQKKMIKEQIEWLIEHKYIRRDESDINTFIYMA